MPDDPAKTREDRKLASPEREYKVAEFAEKYDLPLSEAAAIIKRYGPSRARLDAYVIQRG